MPRSRRRLLAGLCLLVAAGVAPSCAPDRPQFTLTRRPIINGTIDTTHQSVVALVYTAYGSMEQFCTGTVIGKRYVLTAGHCYKESGFPPNQTKIFIGQTVGGGGTVINVANAYVHPQYYLANNGAPVNDVCVVELAQDAPVPVMAWQDTPLGTITGQTVTLVGYGVTNAQSQTGNGTRRTTDQVVSDEDSMYLYYQGGSSGTCQGDSGGPMFLHGGTETIVGVTSFGDQSCVQLGANTRVDIFADFIKQYAGSSTSNPQPVTVSFTQPQNGAPTGSAITVAITAQSAAGVGKVDLYLDGALKSSLAAAPWSFSLSGVADGPHTLRAVATGNDGGTGEASVSVTVSTAQCSAQNPCTTGYDCVGGQCVVHTPAGGCSATSPCFPGFHCENAACVPNAPPAPGTAGAACAQNGDCQSGICVDGSTGHGFCSEQCGSNQDCHNEASCLDMGSGTLLCGPPYSAHPTGLIGPGKEIAGGCAAAARGPAAAPAGALLLLVALALAAPRRRR